MAAVDGDVKVNGNGNGNAEDDVHVQDGDVKVNGDEVAQVNQEETVEREVQSQFDLHLLIPSYTAVLRI
jgi:hypothetical protein